MSRVLSSLLAALAYLAFAATSASAQPPMIGPGHEDAVLGLFAPHELGHEVAEGYALWDVSLQPDHIGVMLRATDGRETTLTLAHPSLAGPHARQTTSFGVIEEGATDDGARRARDVLFDAIARNDHGGFWEVAATTVVETHGPSSARSQFRFAHAPTTDGLLAILAVYVLAVLLASRLLVDAPRWMPAALLGIVVAGVLVRLALSPATFLGAWPWSRLYPHIRVVAEGPGIRMVSDAVGHPFHLTDVMMWTNFAYAAVMPLVLFSHATYLLRDPRAGLAAAFAIAFLPQHIRFSRCEDGFVASLVLTSLAFALIHGWLRDPSRAVRWLLILALPFVLYPGYLLRPLNILFIVVYTLAILGLHGESAPRWRRGVALGIVLAVGAAALAAFLAVNTETAREVTSHWEWPLNVARVLLSPSLLVIDDPMRTPIPLIVLSVVGGVLAWRAGEKRLVLFLSGWLLLFVVAHAVVVQETMEPRYHLHLVVPFLLLAATAVPRIDARWRPGLWASAGVMVVSPWIHGGFIGDVGYTEMEEYEFVREARDMIPAGCTVIEITDSDGHDIRFARIADRPGDEPLFSTVAIATGGASLEGQPSLDEVLRSPPECLFLYEGLVCSRTHTPGVTYQTECSGVRERLRGEVVLERSAPVRLYDESNRGTLPFEVPRIPFRLSRAHLQDEP